MDAKKIQEVINIYRKTLKELGIPKITAPHDRFPLSDNVALAHCHQMLDKMEGFLKEERIEKVFRWLGFVQGVFWCTKIYTIEDAQNHNRPDSPQPQKEISEDEKANRLKKLTNM